MLPTCDFGKQIKHRLVDLDQTQLWLIEEVKKETGNYFDIGYLGRVLRGEKVKPELTDAIRKILSIKE